MHNGRFGTFEAFESAGDEFRTTLDQYLQIHIVRHIALFYAPSGKIEVGLACRREPDFDFLELHVEQQRKHPSLALVPHRIN